MNRIVILAAAAGCTLAMNGKKLHYPIPPKDATVDTYFGHKVADPYRPLEDDTAAATLKWVEAENAVTRGYLDAIPFRADIHKRLTELNNYAKYGLPVKYPDGKYYFFTNNGLQNQSVLYRSLTPDGSNAEMVLDPNTLSADGTVALKGIWMSPDGKNLGYTISRSGSDWEEIFILDPITLQLRDDHIRWAKFTGIAWDGDGFYYSAYDVPEAGKEFSNANEYHKIYFHRLGTPQSADTVAFEDKNAPLHFHHAWTDDKAKALVVSIGGQGNGNALKIKHLHQPQSQWITVTDSQEDNIDVLDIIGDTVYIFTSKDAPNYRIVAAPLSDPRPENWRDIIPEGKSVLVGADITGNDIIVTYLEDASHHAYLHRLSDGKLLHKVKLPSIGSVSFSTSAKSPEVMYRFGSFTDPGALYTYNKDTDTATLLRHTDLKGIDSEDYITEQVFYTSKDGTKVPMFLTYKKGLQRDGKNPVYLYGYGGFNISLEPSFSANRMFWLENGGIYAQTNLRGGGEYGEAWHVAGTKMQKQNVFDDFIAAAEHLIAEGYTTPDLLTIEGGSNGGLLVGAVVNQRPELFRVAIPRVGVMDMMRYHLFTIGWNWAHDYGTSADSPEMAEYLLGYSPLHTIKSGKDVHYPSILVTTADHDDRVVPAHSFKYAAALQAANTGDNPKLIRIDSKAGHGGGKPVAKIIDEWADIYSFVFKNLGLTPGK